MIRQSARYGPRIVSFSLFFSGEVELDPGGKGGDERAEKFPRRVVDEIAGGVEEFVRTRNVDFGLRERRDIQKYQRLSKVVLRPEPLHRKSIPVP